MSLRGENSWLSQPKTDFGSKTLALVERTRLNLQIPSEKWTDILKMTNEEYVNVLKGRKALPLPSLSRLAAHLNLTLENFMDGRIDFPALVAKYVHAAFDLPEQYLKSAFSRRRTVINFLRYLESTRGPLFRDQTLKYFQLSEKHFYVQETKPVNLTLIVELYRYAKRYGFSDLDFHNLGIHALKTNQKTQLADEFRKFKNPIELYENVFGPLAQHYENNCDYLIQSLSSIRCVVEARSKPAVSEEFKVKHLGSLETCTYRGGVLSSILGHIYRPFAKVTETKCVHRGDDICIYELEFPNETRRFY